MSVCNYTQIITPDTCLGDSLATFNSNFSALDEALCRQPDMVGGPGVGAELRISEQVHNTVEFSTQNSFAYGTTFDYLSVAFLSSLPLNDGTTIPVTVMPYVPYSSWPIPLATFSTISLTKNVPSVSIFWTASGYDISSTVFLTNSATSDNKDIGNSPLDGAVTCFLSSGNVVYVGGSFTHVGNFPCNKLAVMNLLSGTPDPNYSSPLGTAGALLGAPGALSAYGGFGTTGTINAIAEWDDLLIFGGTYQSPAYLGRGLTIYSKTTGKVFPFYVNGDVNCLAVVGNDLYVGGTFDYINYLPGSASVLSGLRKYTNGIVRIALTDFIRFPNTSIDSAFAANVAKNFNNLATINTITSKSNVVYIGGLFSVYSGSNLAANNLAIINGDGTINLSWNPVVTGEVYTLAVDGNYLYAGGNIKSYHTISQFFGSPRPLDIAYNAISFNATNPFAPTYEFNWKPKFNGPVSKFVFHNTDIASYVYCYGGFTHINGYESAHIAVVDKSYNNSKTGQNYLYWTNGIGTPPSKITNALLKTPSNSLLVGGGFTQINETTRRGIARIKDYNQYSPSTVRSMTWSIGAQICSPGTSLSSNLSAVSTITAFSRNLGTLNETIFSSESLAPALKHCKEGSLLKFFIQRRKGTGDSLTKPVHVIGWKVNFN